MSGDQDECYEELEQKYQTALKDVSVLKEKLSKLESYPWVALAVSDDSEFFSSVHGPFSSKAHTQEWTVAVNQLQKIGGRKHKIKFRIAPMQPIHSYEKSGPYVKCEWTERYSMDGRDYLFRSARGPIENGLLRLLDPKDITYI